MKNHIITLLATFAMLLSTQAQNDMQSLTKSIAYAASLKNAEDLTAANKELQNTHEALEKSGVKNLQFFTQTIGGKAIVLATMDIAEDADPDTLWTNAQKKFNTVFAKINTAILPHQRHAEDKTKSPWVSTETVCKLRPHNATDPNQNSSWHSAVTQLKKEKEAEYRLLHNNVWPGVIHAIGASNINRFDIFLIEFGDNQPYLFYLFQYTGSDFANDMKAQSESPVNQRWWKFTDTCQSALPEAKHGPWLDMISL